MEDTQKPAAPAPGQYDDPHDAPRWCRPYRGPVPGKDPGADFDLGRLPGYRHLRQRRFKGLLGRLLFWLK